METSPFGKLPGELRNRIYHFFFATQLPSTVQLDIRDAASGPRLKLPLTKTRSALALTATSRQLRAETLAIFWSSAPFRIVTDTLSIFSAPNDDIPAVLPLNRAHHINQDRAHALATWLQRSGIAYFAHIAQPIELDLGTWNPQINSPLDQAQEARVLRLLGEDTAALTAQLLALHGSKSKSKARSSFAGGASSEPTLRFSVHIHPSTAMGPIRVPNEREQAMATIGGLSKARVEKVEANFQKGFLTDFGRRSLVNDIVLCRSAAEMLVPYIVAEAENEEDVGDEGEGGEGEGVGEEGNTENRPVKAGSGGRK